MGRALAAVALLIVASAALLVPSFFAYTKIDLSADALQCYFDKSCEACGGCRDYF